MAALNNGVMIVCIHGTVYASATSGRSASFCAPNALVNAPVRNRDVVLQIHRYSINLIRLSSCLRIQALNLVIGALFLILAREG